MERVKRELNRNLKILNQEEARRRWKVRWKEEGLGRVEVKKSPTQKLEHSKPREEKGRSGARRRFKVEGEGRWKVLASRKVLGGKGEKES